jgi:hypothetical protein
VAVERARDVSLNAMGMDCGDFPGAELFDGQAKDQLEQSSASAFSAARSRGGSGVSHRQEQSSIPNPMRATCCACQLKS